MRINSLFQEAQKSRVSGNATAIYCTEQINWQLNLQIVYTGALGTARSEHGSAR